MIKKFGPLGIEDTIWRANPQGIDLGYDGMWLRPHEMAKIGGLFMKKGRWGDKQIISEACVEASTKNISAPHFLTDTGTSGGSMKVDFL